VEFGELAGRDAYEVLGVDPDASPEEIRRAYRSRVKACHPDLFTDPSEKAAADQGIRLLNAAYEVLENRRAAYDAFRADDAEIIDDPWDTAEAGAAGPGPQAPPPVHRPMPPPPLYRPAYGASANWGPQEHQQGLTAAGELFRHVVTGGDLAPLPASPVIVAPGEYPYADLPVEYSRFYGMDVTYRTNSVIPFGRPTFIITALAANALGNAVARSRARSQAAAQWREQQIAGALLTSQRLSIGTQVGRLSFWHQGLAEFLPQPDRFNLVLIFHDTEPVMLRGPGAPWLSVAMARLLFPAPELTQIPGFAGMTAWLGTAGG
jgi:hypothetical protein